MSETNGWTDEEKEQLKLIFKTFNYSPEKYFAPAFFLSLMFEDTSRKSFRETNLSINDLYSYFLFNDLLFQRKKKIIDFNSILKNTQEIDEILEKIQKIEDKNAVKEILDLDLIQFFLIKNSSIPIISFSWEWYSVSGDGTPTTNRIKYRFKDLNSWEEIQQEYKNGLGYTDTKKEQIFSLIKNLKFENSIDTSIHFTEENEQKISSLITFILNKGWDDLIFDPSFDYFSTIIREGYSFSGFNKKISNRIGEMVRSLKKVEVNLASVIETEGFFYNTKENFNIFDVIEDGENYKIIPEQLYPDQKGINKQAPILTGSTIFYLQQTYDLQHFIWPDDVYGKDGRENIGPENQAALDELKNFHTLDDTSIDTYGFNYYKTPDLEQPPPFFSWFDKRPTTNELIRLKLTKLYVDFIKDVFSDIKEDGEISATISSVFNKYASDRNIEGFYRYILIDKELARRIAVFKFFEAQKFEDIDQPNEIEDLKNKSAEIGQDAWNIGEASEIKDDTLNEEDIKNRQKFFKQCALMMNMSTLRDLYVDKIQKQTVPFDGRFIMAHCQGEDQEKLITNLISNKEGQTLIEAQGYQISSLVPKIRLYKVINETTGKLNEVEFIFPANHDLDRKRDFTQITSTFLQNDFDKGSGCGIKQFSFEFNGTNPTEARSDIKADLTLYFQSFMDFIEERVSYNGEVYRFVDLIIQPKPDDEGKVLNEKIIHSNEYNPAFYRIRAEVGYEVPQSGDIAGELRDSIIVNNKSFYLCMVDHNLNFKNDGSVEIQISYRAYVETALKNPKMDALASPELIERRIKNQEILENALAERKCTKDELRELTISIQSSEEVLIKKSLSSILTRLKNRGAIYNVSLKEEDRSHFNTKGYFKTCSFESVINTNDGGEDLGIALRTRLPEKSEDFSFTDSNNKVIQFFYFGDLLYTILDCVFDEKNNFRSNTMLNTRMILGSFEFESFNSSEQTENKVYNIAYMPISVDFFSRWFVDNVMSQKDSRKTFPVLNFVRNLSNSLIKPALLENCVNRKIENVTRFATTQVTGYYESGEDELLKEGVSSNGSINTSSEAQIEGSYPLKGDGDGKTNINNFFSYIIVSTNGSSLTYTGTGTYADDIPKGRYHIGLGQDRGLVKNISLSKTDLQYIREARFMQQGIDGLLQLASVYKLNVEMFGNTLFYPGMEFYFNPYGLGGSTSFGAPNKKGSIANKLGIGGYHTITSVKSTISPGKFTTSIQAQQYYSGDGTGNSLLKREGRKQLNIGDYTPEEPNTDCTATVLSFHNEQNAFNLTENNSVNKTNIEDNTNTPTETVSTAEQPISSSNDYIEVASTEIVSVSVGTVGLESEQDRLLTTFDDGTMMLQPLTQSTNIPGTR